MKKYVDCTVNSFCTIIFSSNFPGFNCNCLFAPLNIISNRWQVFKRIIKRLIYTILCEAEIHWSSLKFFLDVFSVAETVFETKNYKIIHVLDFPSSPLPPPPPAAFSAKKQRRKVK